MTLTLNFYKRNYIEGLFLSSGIIRDGDYTLEEMVRVVRSLRNDHDFRGYIHLKLIPEASPALVEEAALYADRVSINMELPRDDSLKALAPEKSATQIRKAMGDVRFGIESRSEKGRKTRPPKFAPAGQSTQLIVGADGATDGEILTRSSALYGGYKLRRVYYSAFQPDPGRHGAPAAAAAADDAGTPAVSGRLADALLRLRARGDRRDGRQPRSRHRSEAVLGASPPRPSSRST